jgi:hypothetical protein
VNEQLRQQSAAGLFSTPFSSVDRRVQVFTANIDYLEEVPED